MKTRYRWAVGLALIVCVTRSILFVDETEFAIVTQFGRPVRTLATAGPALKLPYQSAIRIDRRLQLYDPRPSEFLALEKKNVDLDVFVCWRVDQPQQFLETVGDVIGAEARLHDIIWAELAATIGRQPLEALVSTDAEQHKLGSITEDLTARCEKRVRDAYGIEIVDIGLKRITLPMQVRESVFQRMRSERDQLARRYRAEGDRDAMTIRAEADKKKTVVLAQAYREAEGLRGEGEAEAARIYAAAYKEDPELFELLRSLEAYKKFLDEKTTLLLSADSELFRYLNRRSPAPARAEE